MSASLLVPPDPELTLAQKSARALTVLALAGVAGFLLWTLSFLLAPIALAVVVFYCLSPVVNWLERRRISRPVGVLLCFAVAFGLLSALAYVIWPTLSGWISQIPAEGQRSGFEVQLDRRLREWEALERAAYPKINWDPVFNKLHHLLDSERKQLVENLPEIATGLFSHLGSLFLVPIVALFLLLDGWAMHRRVVALVPNRYFESVLVMLHRVDRQIAAYLRGAASESALVALLLSLLLAVAGMPHPLLFGCLYGLANVVPLVGPLVGAGAGLLYALMDPSAPPLTWLAAAYLGGYVIDASLINPWVVAKNLNLHPLTVILGVTIGGSLGGILGMLVSIPLIAVSKAVAFTLLETVDRRRQARLAVHPSAG